MKKNMFRSIFLILIISVAGIESSSQIVTQKASNANPNSGDIGFYYALPQTSFKIEIIYEKVTSLAGPLSTYASEYLGIQEIIEENDVEYNVVDIKLSKLTESDPEQIYFVKLPVEREKDSKPNTFYLNKMGGLIAYNTIPENTDLIPANQNNINYYFDNGTSNFPYLSQYNKRKKTDTIIRQINIDTLVIDRFLYKSSWVDKSNEDKAKEAAQQIDKLRESRYNLISGYHEVNFGQSIAYMDEQLKIMERRYMDLFTGKTIKTVESSIIHFTPDPGTKSKEIFSLKNGVSVIMRIVPDNKSQIPDKPNNMINSVYYRIPANAIVEISSANIVYLSEKHTINQLGTISSVSLKNSKIVFDSETGNILSFYQE